MATPHPRILVVDDLQPARRLLVEAIQAVLEKQGKDGRNLVETSSFTETAVLFGQKFDFAFIDLHLPDGRGWDIIRNLKKDPDILVAAVTVMDDRASVEATLAAGADGYLIKDAEPELLHFRIERLMAGEPSLSPAIARMMLAHFRPALDPEEDPLTAREREVLSLVGRGLRAREVADHLQISAHTVRDHLKSIYRKLDVSSRAEVAIEAQRRNLT
ncbi:DNA-binding NarL/FixJ family response regulator [Altererythrobacter atlanticus]|nr:response regulator transcription factor [Croceibacterium atlanticum]MBB5731704.1 DNA-binding NarL/FixJ family response regulator [Croceibacterium atlanticum]